jgi:putative membrane protein
MIVWPAPTLWNKTFTLHGSIVVAIVPNLLVAAVVGAAAELTFTTRPELVPTFGFAPFTALGVAISLFLGFRNNACYARWWEGRNRWGEQIIVTRNLARVMSVFTQPNPDTAPQERLEGAQPANDKQGQEDRSRDQRLQRQQAARRTVAMLGVAHSHALRAQLRGNWLSGNPDALLNADYIPDAVTARDQNIPPEFVVSIASCRNPADAILRLAGKQVGIMHSRGDIDSIAAVAISEQLDKLCSVQGACERLATALLPFPYTLLVHRTVVFYILAAPFAMVGTLGWYTVMFNTIVAYTFFGLDEVARQTEQPFGDEPQALPMASMCRTIEISVAEALQDHWVPEPLKPDKNRRLD